MWHVEPAWDVPCSKSAWKLRDVRSLEVGNRPCMHNRRLAQQREICQDRPIVLAWDHTHTFHALWF